MAFIGFEEAAPLAEEAHEPRRRVRIAVLLSCPAVGFFYVVNTYASTVFYGPRGSVGLRPTWPEADGYDRMRSRHGA